MNEEEILEVPVDSSGGEAVEPAVVDLSSIEEKLETLIEAQTLTEEEIAQQEEEKLLQEKEATQNEEVKQQYDDSLLDANLTTVDLLDSIHGELQTLNASIVEMREVDFKESNELVAETGITIVISLIVVMSVKVFIDQITRW